MARGLKIISGAIAFRLYFALFSVLITIALSQYLGVENFGRYAWLTSIAFLLSGLAQAGGNSLVVRETSRSMGRRVPVHVLCRTTLISGGTLVALTAVALLFTGDRMTPALLVPLGLLAVGHLALVLVSASNRGLGHLQAGQIPELVLRPTLFLVLIGGVVLAGYVSGPGVDSAFGSDTMVYLLAAAYAGAGLVAIVLLAQGLAARSDLPDETPETDWLGSFFRLGLIGWLAVGNAQLLVIVTGALADFSQVGLYRVATQAVMIMGLGLTAIETVQAPGYARAWKDGDLRRLHDLLQQSCRIGIAFSAPVMVLLLLLGRPMLGLLFGDSFTAAFPALCLLAGAQLLNALTGNVGVLMIAAKQERKLILGNLAALTATLLAAWLFIPQNGSLAAAGAGAFGLTLRNLLNLWFCYRTLGLVSLPFAPFRLRSDAPPTTHEVP
ncbi:lipopolysaccharide biosynthesis protein [Haliea sp.]